VKRIGLLAVVVALFGWGCFVEVTKVRNPEPLFREARAEAARHAGRPGPAHELNVLAYDPSDHELVRVSLPMWLVRKADRHGDWDLDLDDARGERAKRCLKRHLRLQDLEAAGPGILVEVEEDDGEQVLVWLR